LISRRARGNLSCRDRSAPVGERAVRYFLLRIWTEPISRGKLVAFERRLTADGFSREGVRGVTVSYQAPPDVPDVVDQRPTFMQAVYITPATRADHTTTVMWI
jgi:hypothetical protein